MKEKSKWIKIIYIIGIILLIIGAIDPMEGSIVILVGSTLIALSTYLTQERHWKLFLTTMIMIVIGVCFLFYFSSLGGWGGNSKISWWWVLLVIPYPVGWLLNIIVLIFRIIKKKSKNEIKAH